MNGTVYVNIKPEKCVCILRTVFVDILGVKQEYDKIVVVGAVYFNDCGYTQT